MTWYVSFLVSNVDICLSEVHQMRFLMQLRAEAFTNGIAILGPTLKTAPWREVLKADGPWHPLAACIGRRDTWKRPLICALIASSVTDAGSWLSVAHAFWRFQHQKRPDLFLPLQVGWFSQRCNQNGIKHKTTKHDRIIPANCPPNSKRTKFIKMISTTQLPKHWMIHANYLKYQHEMNLNHPQSKSKTMNHDHPQLWF